MPTTWERYHMAMRDYVHADIVDHADNVGKISNGDEGAMCMLVL